MVRDDSAAAFADAITAGILSNDRYTDNYAGFFMYMYSTPADGPTTDYFKHKTSREYVTN